jgi:hypothetical protein
LSNKNKIKRKKTWILHRETEKQKRKKENVEDYSRSGAGLLLHFCGWSKFVTETDRNDKKCGRNKEVFYTIVLFERERAKVFF